MRVADRLDLVSRIGRELQSRYTFAELIHYLAAFGVRALNDGPSNSKWVYTKEALAPASLETVLKIAADLDIDAPIVDERPTGLPKNWRGTDNFRLFISHISKDKDKATRLREALAPYAISGFVAHEDIHPTALWEQEIERALHTMDAMVAVHTVGFSKSIWTQQEVGFALGRGVKVISLKMGEDPTGFISKRQALARRNRTAEQIAAEIDRLLAEDSRTSDRLTRARNASDSVPF
jgi:hypothetical protein